MKFSQKSGIFVLIFVLFLLAACGGDEETKDTASESNAAQSSTQSTNATSNLPDDPLAAISQALKNQQSAVAYRVKSTITSDASNMEMNAEIRMPDQMRVVTDMGDKEVEMVFVGDKGWMRMDEQWMDSPMKMNDLLHQMNTLSAEMLTEAASDIAKVGNETVDGQEAVLYTYNLDMNKSTTMKMDMKSAVKLWIRTADGLPIKQEVTGEAMGIKSVTVQTIEYDPNITIEPPVKE